MGIFESFKENLANLVRPHLANLVRPIIENSVRLAIAGASRDPEILSTDFLSDGARVDKGTQILLAEKYKELLRTDAPLPSFAEVGFRSFSQFDEDGIILFLFSVLGTTNRTAIEICCGVGFECNCANLVIHHAWEALMVDGNEANISQAQQFFKSRSDTQITVPTLVHAWIEPETINQLCQEHGFTGEIDLLTIDLDGIDYWVWKNLTCVNPRVVIVEYQPWFGPDESYTIKNIPGFTYSENKKGYVGCSLAAYVKLGREKGYRLVGCNRNQLNAFFVRNDLGKEIFPEVSAASCLSKRSINTVSDWIRPYVQPQINAGEWEPV